MRTILWITLATVAASYGIFAYVTVDRRSDDVQVRAVFEQAAQAVEERNLGDAISCVSANYKDPDGLNYDRLRMLTAQALQMEQKFTVDYKLREVKIQGNTATIFLGLDINGTGGKSNAVPYKRNLTVILTKEPGRHALIIPTNYWRVTSIDRLGLDYDNGF